MYTYLYTLLHVHVYTIVASRGNCTCQALLHMHGSFSWTALWDRIMSGGGLISWDFQSLFFPFFWWFLIRRRPLPYLHVYKLVKIHWNSHHTNQYHQWEGFWLEVSGMYTRILLVNSPLKTPYLVAGTACRSECKCSSALWWVFD